MGHTQIGILDTVERIYIKDIGSNKWENFKVSNPNNVDMKFYGAGIFIANNKLYFVGRKVGFGDDDSDYKYEIYSFKYENNEISETEICLKGKLIFIENLLHRVSEENVGNFMDVNDGILATIPMASLLQIVKK